MNYYLEIKNLSFSYNDDNHAGNQSRTVIDSISLNLHKNALLCILGPSGCGKTTLLKIIASMIAPTGGEVFFNKKELKKPDSGRIIIFQDDNQLFPWLDVYDNVSMPLKLCAISNREKTALDIINKVHLAGFENYYPHRLSGGMKKRAAIARALSTSPELLLMDEPFGSLDAQTRKKLHKLVLEIKEKTDLTVIFVTHDIHEAIFLATDIAVMSKAGTIAYQTKNIFTGISDFSVNGFADFYNKLYSYIDEPQLPNISQDSY
jgi:NitT/TauT family transport system ATP-binding protein